MVSKLPSAQTRRDASSSSAFVTGLSAEMSATLRTRSGATADRRRDATRMSESRCTLRASSSAKGRMRVSFHARNSALGRANLRSAACDLRAASSPRLMMSALRFRSALVKPSRSGVMRTSSSVRLASDSRTFCSVSRFTICAMTPTTELSSLRFERGVPTLTTISTCAPMLRASSTGRLSTSPPSTRSLR